MASIVRRLIICMDVITGSGALFYSLETARFLLLHRTKTGNKCWGLAGGKMEDKETPWEGLQREINEELGLEPNIIKTIPLETFISNDEHFQYHTYLCVVREEFIPNLNEEHDGYAWASVENLPRPLHNGLSKTLKNRTSKGKLDTVLKLIDELL
jgi:8-oxo-dGTP pyrophosphatase MutT (NUDIX family)